MIINLIYRQIKFQNKSSGSGIKRVAAEEVLEIEDLSTKQFKPNENPKTATNLGLATFAKPAPKKPILSNKASLANLVKRKTPATSTSTDSAHATSVSNNSSNASNSSAPSASIQSSNTAVTTSNKPNALSLLGSYNDSDSNDSDD